jgi:hypothetical protein
MAAEAGQGAAGTARLLAPDCLASGASWAEAHAGALSP